MFALGETITRKEIDEYLRGKGINPGTEEYRTALVEGYDYVGDGMWVDKVTTHPEAWDVVGAYTPSK